MDRIVYSQWSYTCGFIFRVIATSLQHSVLGGLRNGRNPVPDEVPTMAEHFHRAGYQTALLTTNPNAGRISNLDRGVDIFLDTAIQAELEQGEDLGVTGTPAYFINGRMISGARPFPHFAEVIDDELELEEGVVERPVDHRQAGLDLEAGNQCRDLPGADVGGQEEYAPAVRQGALDVFPPGHIDRCQKLLRPQALDADCVEGGAAEVAGHRARELTPLGVGLFGEGEGEVEVDDLAPPAADQGVDIAENVTDRRQGAGRQQPAQTSRNPKGRKLDVISQCRPVLAHDTTPGNSRHRPRQLPSIGSISASTTQISAPVGSLTASFAVVTGTASAAWAAASTSHRSSSL